MSTECQCNAEGSTDVTTCGAQDGQCACKPNVVGQNCDACAEGYSMGGFPTCQKEIMIKYHVIDALYNKGMESVEVKNTAATNGLKSGLTDAGGFVYLGPYAPGESIQIEVNHDGFDAVDQVITASEDVDFMMLGLNPTVNEILLYFFSLQKY